MPRYIEIAFVDDGVTAKAVLLDEQAPRTCATLVKHMPFESKGIHARYSGAEVAMFLDNRIRVAPEHATSAVLPGEVAYVFLKKEEHFNLPEDVSEICWFYDRDAQPREWEGPVRVNIFARVVENLEAFAKSSADCRLVGPKRVRIRLLKDGQSKPVASTSRRKKR